MAFTADPVGRQSSHADFGLIKIPLGFQDYADDYNQGNGPPVGPPPDGGPPTVTVTPTSMSATGGAMLALAGSEFSLVTNVSWQDGPDAGTTTESGEFNSWTMVDDNNINVDATENWIQVAQIHKGESLYVVVVWSGVVEQAIVPVALT
jgi:hypothetical protein